MTRSKSTSKSAAKKKVRPAIEWRAVTKDHGDFRALGPLDLTLNPGESVALLGHNGSGKSTLMGLAAGVLDPSDGEIRVFGEPAGEMAARASLSYVRDHPVLYEDLSVREHLDYLSRLHGSDADAHDATGIIERLGLSARIDDVPSSFSRGLRQKAALAIAFCRPFNVLLIDEPFAGLDPAGQDALIALLSDVSAAGATVVVATHDLARLPHFDRAVMLSDGELVYDGPPSAVPRPATPTP